MDTFPAASAQRCLDPGLIPAFRKNGIVRHLADIGCVPDDAATFTATAQGIRRGRFNFIIIDPLMDQTMGGILIQYGNGLIR